MADFGKLRNRRSVLGAPPPIEEVSENLAAPELAPQAAPAPPPPAPTQIANHPRVRRDGRTLRRTNRTVAFATRVSAEWDDQIRDIAERDGLMLVEVLERAVDAYEAARSKPSAR